MKTYGLTDAELAVAARVAMCWTVKQIAGDLNGISPQAVHQHIDRIVMRWNLEPERDARTQIAKRFRELTATAAA